MNYYQWIKAEMNQMEERWHWTLPLGPDGKGGLRCAYLILPERHLTEAEWRQMMLILEHFKAGLILDKPETEVIADLWRSDDPN